MLRCVLNHVTTCKIPSSSTNDTSHLTSHTHCNTTIRCDTHPLILRIDPPIAIHSSTSIDVSLILTHAHSRDSESEHQTSFDYSLQLTLHTRPFQLHPILLYHTAFHPSNSIRTSRNVVRQFSASSPPPTHSHNAIIDDLLIRRPFNKGCRESYVLNARVQYHLLGGF